MSTTKRLIQNGILVVKTGQVVLSTHRHDFNTASLPSGRTYSVDGGLDYCRRVAEDLDDPEVQDITVYSDDMARKQQFLCWGTRGKDGKQPLKYIFIKDMTPEHLKAVIEMSKSVSISPEHLEVMKYWSEQKESVSDDARS